MSVAKDKQVEGSDIGTSYEGDSLSGKAGDEVRMGRVNYDARLNTEFPKLDFAQFGRDNPSEWIMMVNKYFQIHQISEELKLGIVEMYLKGRADIWFHGFLASHHMADWSLMATKLFRRFAKNTGEEVVETFTKIKQYG
ncbi:Uncharacterized protein Adt_05719 [Abeliophyllum distichum]|uniref:Retrotransposon gag domain-containing protein n=1 Tax=Abeliophyllum distichum TaxID=126358 RepID=A0ABD1V717_9LAMI